MSKRTSAKNDLRVRFTQQQLYEHLLTLLKTKPLEKITVKELCEAANIHRATFYTHYSDIYNLMAQIKEKMVADISKHICIHLQTEEARKNDSLVQYLYYLQKNKDLYILLIQERGVDSLRELTWEIAAEHYLGKGKRNPQSELLLARAVYGTTAIIEFWLQKKVPLSEEEIADMILRLSS